MKIHVLQCGSIRVDPTVPFGKRLDLIEAAKQLTAADKNRITLPVFTYLIEHPQGLILVDTGWCREISPDGVYDPKAAAAAATAAAATPLQSHAGTTRRRAARWRRWPRARRGTICW